MGFPPCGPAEGWRLLLCCFCWLNWTANQSCFSPLSLFLHFATERGRCLDSSPKRHVCCRLESRNGAKNRQECEQRGIQNPSAVVRAKMCVNFSPAASHCLHWLVSCVFDHIIVCNCRKTFSICNKANVVAEGDNPTCIPSAACENKQQNIWQPLRHNRIWTPDFEMRINEQIISESFIDFYSCVSSLLYLPAVFSDRSNHSSCVCVCLTMWLFCLSWSTQAATLHPSSLPKPLRAAAGLFCATLWVQVAEPKSSLAACVSGV